MCECVDRTVREEEEEEVEEEEEEEEELKVDEVGSHPFAAMAPDQDAERRRDLSRARPPSQEEIQQRKSVLSDLVHVMLYRHYFLMIIDKLFILTVPQYGRVSLCCVSSGILMYSWEYETLL